MAASDAFDILIVGAGPAGLAAAVTASRSGKRVGVIDDNLEAGGQIWRGEATKPSSREAIAWFERVKQVRFEMLCSTQIFGAPAEGMLLADRVGDAITLRYQHLILATGARELFLPFPGWTLPNVMGAGGLQAMVKGGLPITGKRVVVAGSGPLLLAVAAYLKKKGAKIELLAEQASASSITRFAANLWRTPSKIVQAIDLKYSLGGVRQQNGCWPVEALGKDRLEAVVMTDGMKRWSIECDYLACGFGLVPNVELALAFGCQTAHGFVTVDGSQLTTVPHVYASGELTGIGGLELSLVEGQIAGYAATGDIVAARELFPDRERALSFARRLAKAFELRPELRSLAHPDTIVCRCEDVPHKALAHRASWLDAKLQTRCGMGPCQGRICGAAAEVLYGWGRTSNRPPVLPVPLGHLSHQDSKLS